MISCRSTWCHPQTPLTAHPCEIGESNCGSFHLTTHLRNPKSHTLSPLQGAKDCNEGEFIRQVLYGVNRYAGLIKVVADPDHKNFFI